MSDDDLTYSTDFWWQVEHEVPPEEVRDTSGDIQWQSGNIKRRDEDGDHYFISKEIADGEAESRDAGEVGGAMSEIEGFDPDDVPLWDGDA